MTLSAALLQDPIALTELCAVIFTCCYLAKLALAPLPFAFEAGNAAWESADREIVQEGARRRRNFSGLFSVGELISLPKQSLLYQQNSRRRGI